MQPDDPRVPAQDIWWLVSRRHVWTPDDEIRADIEQRCPTETDAALIKACGDYAVHCHHENRREFLDVTQGRLSHGE